MTTPPHTFPTGGLGPTRQGAVVVAACCLSVAGCATLPKRSFVPPVDPATLDDSAFVHYLAAVPTVTVAEGVRGVLLLAGDTKRWPTYPQQRDELVRRGAFKLDWNLSAGDTLDMGTLGHMLRVMCDLSPGVSERLTGLTGWGDRRYALRRCVDAGILPYAASPRAVRGGEIVAALAESEKFVTDSDSTAPKLPEVDGS